MNKVFLIGNLTRDPELRTTQSGIAVCQFTIAVNRRRANNAEAGQPEADFFRVTAWRQLAEICGKWLIRGKKVSVVGTVSASAYIGSDGTARASLEVTEDDVEFLSPANEAISSGAYAPPSHQVEGRAQPAQTAQRAHASPTPAAPSTPPGSGFIQVEDEDLPF